MGTTPLGIPYPEGGDPPAGHTQMRALAEYIDGIFAGAKLSGTVAVPALDAGETSAVIPIPFPPGMFATPPVVLVTPSHQRLNVAIQNPVTIDGAGLVAANWTPGGALASVAFWIAVAQ